MCRRTIFVTAFLLLFGFALAVQAQRGPRAGREGGSGPSGVDARFESTAPGIGEPMPDLVVHDAGGKELRLQELLLGHYSVLVLGCLT